jgi:hypothetical protein
MSIYIILCLTDQNVDIDISAHDLFLEWFLSGTLITKILEGPRVAQWVR